MAIVSLIVMHLSKLNLEILLQQSHYILYLIKGYVPPPFIKAIIVILGNSLDS